MSADKDDFAAYTTIGDRTEQPAEARAPLHARPSGPSFAPPPKLEPFLLLAKSARGAGAAGLVSQAVGAPGVYVFGELLEQPSIKDLANHEQHAAQYRLLELFAYGTWADYEAKRDSFPALTPEQETKLKHLTILTLASSQRVIPYATLLSLLALPDVPTLEDLLIGAFYAHVLHGKLDAKAQRLEVLSAQGRDVRPSAPQEQEESMELDAPASGASSAAQSPATLLAALSTFQATLGGLIASLTAHLSALHAHAANTAAHAAAHEQRVRGVAEEVSKEGTGGKKGRGAGGGAGKTQQQREPAGEGDMDVDSAPAPGGSSTVGAFPGMGALAGAFGLTGSGGGPQGTARGAAGSPTGGGAGARARKRGRQ
ncbi:hypothetical protein JCM10449v2_006330 [Rhodotorula kratochvilovae]